ncbi:hypothetical protein KFE98_16955 [bacterium SCSIO 12741]|nr:hypothetical protein KFE98_16955 [bacterium SCSIO 12741]
MITVSYSTLIMPDDPPPMEVQQQMKEKIEAELKKKKELEATLLDMPEFDPEIPIKAVTLEQIRMEQEFMLPSYWEKMYMHKEQSTEDSTRVFDNLVDLIDKIVTSETKSYEACQKFEKKYHLTPRATISSSIERGKAFVEENE